MSLDFPRSVRPIKLFLSYSTKDRLIATEIKEALVFFGFEVFLAHQDVRPSLKWQQTILHELKACDVFLPLLTRNFRSSFWTDQECGVALVLEKEILPVAYPYRVYGFLSAYQWLNGHKMAPQDIAFAVLMSLATNEKFKERVKPGFIRRWCWAKADSKEVVTYTEVLILLAPFSYREMNVILTWGGQHYRTPSIVKAIDKLVARRGQRYSNRAAYDFAAWNNHIFSSPTARQKVKAHHNWIWS